jgi:hypothetical protein
MHIRKTIALAALLSLSCPTVAFAAKEAKVPRCNGQSKRTANPYGTVLPTLPSRTAGGSASTTKPTQLFPPSASPSASGSAASDITVPPISAASPVPHDGRPQPVYASC